jgi:hypothetical protein
MKENSPPQQSILFISIIVLVIAAKPLLWDLSMNVAYFLPDTITAEQTAKQTGKGESGGMLSASNRLRILASDMAARQNGFFDHLENYMMDESDPNSTISVLKAHQAEGVSFWREIKGRFQFMGNVVKSAGDKVSNWTVGFAAHAINLVVWFAAILQVPAYILQFCLRHLFETTIALGISLLAVPALRQIGTTYIGMSISVLLWPLGFLVVNKIADVSIDLCLTAMPPQGAVSFLYLLVPLIPASILITGTFMVPSFCYSLCTQGGSAAMPNAAMGGFVAARAATGVAERAVGAVGMPAAAGARQVMGGAARSAMRK